MADPSTTRSTKRGEDVLRRRLRKMFSTERSFVGIAHELAMRQSKGWRPILFGGFLRDVMVLGPKKWPRDIDIVVGLQTTDELEQELVGVHHHRNRFGGLRCEIEKWNCDV